MRQRRLLPFLQIEQGQNFRKGFVKARLTGRSVLDEPDDMPAERAEHRLAHFAGLQFYHGGDESLRHAVSREPAEIALEFLRAFILGKPCRGGWEGEFTRGELTINGLDFHGAVWLGFVVP